ncbi:MAG: SusC/RagA family TonB-linked outer membrane protein [Bacteroidota bacterium]|nr:SusC/RagA family TonB-linked outer membrane protein [Bacteroidota bacterium]
MRVSLFLILISTFQVLAGASYSQTTRLSLSMKNSTVREVLGQIEDQSNFYFLYNNQLIDVERKVNVEVKNEKIEVILSKIFEAGTVNTLIRDRHIIITPADGVSFMQQQKSVSGKVTDNAGLGLPGVTVVVKGTQTGTVTSGDGSFSFAGIPENATLQFSFIGMKSQEVFVGNKSNLAVVMEVETFGVDEVVVTALGIRRSERALGYSVQRVSGESLQKVSAVDVASSLTGKVAGLLVRNTPDFNGAPVVTIRGENPLLVIDGVAYQNKTLSDISSEDIESLSVLKGATASALYGFRGASGAILVTTKNGTSNLAGLSVDVASNTMFGAGFLALPEQQSTYGRGGNNAYDKNSDSSWGPLMDGTVRNQWDPFLKAYADYPYVASGKDNFANFLEQAYITNNNVNVGYKGDVLALRSSVNWTQNTGVYPNQKADRYTYSFGGDINLDKFKLNSNMSYSKKVTPNQSTNSYTGYDPMYSLLIWSSADFNILDYKDNYWITPHQTQNYTLPQQNNPYFNIWERTNEVHRDIYNVDLSMSYQLTDWLKASVRSGFDYYTDKGQLRIAWGSRTSSGNTGVPGNANTWIGGSTGGYMIGQTQGQSINTDLLLTGDRSFDKFKVEYLAGGTIYRNQDNNILGSTNGGLSVPDFFSLKASVNPAGTSTYSRGQQVNSIYGRFAVSYNKWVYLEATGRNDWNSTMVNTQAESYFYPSVAASLVISEFLPGTTNWLDLLKVRGSWTMSKTPAGIYETTVNSAFTINPATWNTLNGAAAPGNLYGLDLLPASANTSEVGLQAMLFKNRLNFDVTYYDKHMYDFVKTAPLSGASGYTGRYINIDEEQSRRGWEIALGGAIVKSQDWQWDMGINWSTFARKYTKLDAIYSPKNSYTAVGERVDVLYGLDYMREPATGKRVWANGQLQFNPYDTKLGYIDPDFIWGVNSTLRYKDFSLFVSFDGVSGGNMNSSTDGFMWRSGVHPESVTPERALDVATPGSKNFLGDGVKVVSGTFGYDVYGNITSDTRVFAPNDIKTTYKDYVNAEHSNSVWGARTTPADTHEKTFIKLRELALTYTVPKKYLHSYAKAASVSLVGQNVLLWAKNFKYSDPDSGGYAPWGTNGNATGSAEDLSDPALRYLGVNVKLTF